MKRSNSCQKAKKTSTFESSSKLKELDTGQALIDVEYVELMKQRRD